MFAVVDANYNLIYIDVGTNGRTNDALVFSKCSFNQALENGSLKISLQGIFVGDDAFALRMNLLKPYSKNALNIKERVFNYRLSTARRVSELLRGTHTVLRKLSASANQNSFGTHMSSVPAPLRSDFLIITNSVE